MGCATRPSPPEVPDVPPPPDYTGADAFPIRLHRADVGEGAGPARGDTARPRAADRGGGLAPDGPRRRRTLQRVPSGPQSGALVGAGPEPPLAPGDRGGLPRWRRDGDRRHRRDARKALGP